MSDDTAGNRKSYASFLGGTARRMYALLRKDLVSPDELPGDFERHLIGALEIVSGSSVQFIDEEQMTGYQFVKHKSNLSRLQFVERNNYMYDGLDSYEAWKSGESGRSRNPAFRNDRRTSPPPERSASSSQPIGSDDQINHMENEIRTLKHMLAQLLDEKEVSNEASSDYPSGRDSAKSRYHR